MTRRIDEIRVVRNPLLGASVLWYAASTYSGDVGVDLGIELAVLVLPLVLHRATLQRIKDTQRRTSLYNIVSRYPRLPLGFHERVLEFLPLTFRSMNVGLAAEILKYDGDEGKIGAVGKIPATPGLRDMVRGGKRVGALLAGVEPTEAMLLLGVRC